MRVVFLGTGGGGNPPIGIDREAAGITNRTSNALIVQPNYPDPPTILIDAGIDIRTQWATWHEAPVQPDAVILTHEHHDHMGGIQQFHSTLRPVPVYATARTLRYLAGFDTALRTVGGRLNLEPHELPERGMATVAGVEIETMQLHHLVPGNRGDHSLWREGVRAS